MTTLIIIAAALGFFALIMASIALHEVGHLLPGKLFDVKITQYYVGFGRTLWKVKRGETEYGIKMLPLGGYVRLIGMYPPSSPGDGLEHAGPVARIADSARGAEHATVTGADKGRLFYEKKTWQKIIIMAGGPAMNLMLAFGIFLGVNLIHGQYVPDLVVSAVSDCAVPAARASDTCKAGDPASPAKAAGLQVGDRIVSFNGVALDAWDDLTTMIRANGDGPALIVVKRDGREVALTPTSTIVTGVVDQRDPSKVVSAGFLGVSPTYDLQRVGALVTAQDMWTMTKQTMTALLTFPVKVWNVASDLVMGRERDPNGPMSIVGASVVAGEIAGTDQLGVANKIASWFLMLGSVNLFVGVFNLVPLLPLDGGHIAGALYEGARRRLALLLRRPDPGPVDTAKMVPVAYVVGGFLALSGLILVIADIISPIKLF
ncbi:MAG TPA: site-2 protease family protein [Propionibacteriaceae bacterium]|nr:site-2 protease family protein [Propionibacteriaceae bacterium]